MNSKRPESPFPSCSSIPNSFSHQQHAVHFNITMIKYTMMFNLMKPFRVFWYTLVRWWPPRICMLLCFILFIVLAAGFRLKANESIYEFDNNIEDRSIVWYFVGLFSSTFISFYIHEWILYDEEQRERDGQGRIIDVAATPRNTHNMNNNNNNNSRANEDSHYKGIDNDDDTSFIIETTP